MLVCVGRSLSCGSTPLFSVPDLHSPDFFRIFFDRPVAGEFAHPGHVEDRAFGPGGPVGIDFAHQLLALEVGFEIKQQQIRVVFAEQVIDQRPEQLGVAVAEGAAANGVDNRSAPPDCFHKSARVCATCISFRTRPPRRSCRK